VAVVDEQWVRLVDVGAALGARTYGSWLRGVVISVHDPQLPANDGAWLVDHDGASRTDEPPDLVCDVAALGAAYLGGTSWRTLVAAGLVETPGGHDAVVAADGLFAVRPLPYCGTFF
jgi:predicted acetyltransferase